MNAETKKLAKAWLDKAAMLSGLAAALDAKGEAELRFSGQMPGGMEEVEAEDMTVLADTLKNCANQLLLAIKRDEAAIH